MKEKIRYKLRNPIREMLETQGKRYTIKFIVPVVLLAILTVAAFILNISPTNWIGLVALIAIILIWGWLFAIEKVYPDEEEY